MHFELGSVTVWPREPNPSRWKVKNPELEITGEPMPDCEQQIWDAFLSRYWDDREFRDFGEQWVPPEVFEKYAEVMDAFDYCQIWATEKKLHPILLGFVENEEGRDDCYLIARWDEPGVFLSLEDVKRTLRLRAQMKRNGMGRRYLKRWVPDGLAASHIATVIAMVLGGVLVIGYFTHDILTDQNQSPTIVDVIMIPGLAGFWITQIDSYIKGKRWRKEPIEEACDEHDELVAESS